MVAWDSVKTLNEEIEEKDWKLWQINNRPVFAESNLRGKSGEWFMFLRFGKAENDAYLVATNLDIDIKTLRYIYSVCADSGVPFWFVNEILFSESRMGTNVKHKTNRDGSIDSGFFGLNSRNHPTSSGNPRKDVFKFVAYFNKHIKQFPEHDWKILYRFGETRARKYGFVYHDKP